MKKTLSFILSLVMLLGIFAFLPETVQAAGLSAPKITSVNTIAKGIKISWDKIKNAENYIIYRRTYNASTQKWGGWVKIKSNYASTSYVDTTVALSTYYRYTVRAASGKTLSGYTSTSNIKYNVVPTATITNANNGIAVKWEKIASATGYTLYSASYSAKTQKWSGWTNRGTTKATTSSWTDKKVKNGVIYRYTVRAVYSGGKTNFKATSGLRFLTQPTVSVANTASGVKVNWGKNASATSYAVYKAAYTNGAWSSWQLLETTKNNVFSYTDKKAVSGQTYRYTVRAVNSGSKSAFTAKTIVFLAQPTVTVASTEYGIQVKWTQSKGAKNYALYRSEYVDGEWTSWFRITTIPGTAYVDSDSVKGIKYRYTAKALNGSYSSAYKASSTIIGSVTPNNENTQAIMADPYAFYSKAANKIHTQGIAGYKKVSWQTLEEPLTLDKFEFLSDILTDLLAGFLTTEDQADVMDNPKGSDDAMQRMPASNCDKKYIKSATAQKTGDTYVITIVLNSFTNPSYDDTDGLSVMSREFLDMRDVEKTVATDSAVNKVVKGIDGTITYTDYTIKAEMTADGKFISITHYGVGDICADVQMNAGIVGTSGTLSFNAKYYDFVY